MKLGIRRCLVISSMVLTGALAVCCFSPTAYRLNETADLDRNPAKDDVNIDRWSPDGAVDLDTRLHVTDYERALATIRARGVDLDQERYSHLRLALRRAKSEGGFSDHMLERVAVQFQDTGLTCEAKFHTYSEGQLVDGAIVRYRLITAGGLPGRVEGLTSSDARKTLDIGFYHVWAQRDGVPTSPTTEVFDLFEEQRTIDLVEDR